MCVRVCVIVFNCHALIVYDVVTVTSYRLLDGQTKKKRRKKKEKKKKKKDRKTEKKKEKKRKVKKKEERKKRKKKNPWQATPAQAWSVSPSW